MPRTTSSRKTEEPMRTYLGREISRLKLLHALHADLIRERVYDYLASPGPPDHARFIQRLQTELQSKLLSSKPPGTSRWAENK